MIRRSLLGQNPSRCCLITNRIRIANSGATHLDVDEGLVDLLSPLTGPGTSHVPLLDITTDWWPCGGVHDFVGWIVEDAIWPNGVTSSGTLTWTYGSDGIVGDIWTGSC